MKFKASRPRGIAVAIGVAVPALAHHSFAMFDASKLVTLDGTVKEFQWTNPHAWILLMVPDGEGQPAQWAIEMNGPTGLVRDGWYPKTLTPGMKVKIVDPSAAGRQQGRPVPGGHAARRHRDGQSGRPRHPGAGPRVQGRDAVAA